MSMIHEGLHHDLLRICDEAHPPVALAALTESICWIMAENNLGPDDNPEAFRAFMEMTGKALVQRTRTIARELAPHSISGTAAS